MATKTTPTKFETREAWLGRAVELLRPVFESAGAPIPERVRVSVGWPMGSRGGKGVHAIAQCWCKSMSADETFEIFVSPELDDPARVLDCEAHELVHAAVGLAEGHKGEFVRVAKAIGLVGRMTATTAGPEFTAWAEGALEELGAYPHAALGVVVGAAPHREAPEQPEAPEGEPVESTPRQKGRMVKVECPSCGMVARTTRKWLDSVGLPTCACGAQWVESEPAEAEAVEPEANLVANLVEPEAAGPVLLVTTAHPSLHQHPDPETGAAVHGNLGRLLQPRHTSSAELTALEGITWAADNDCFQGLDAQAFYKMLDRLKGLPGCRFVTVPDVVGDARATAIQFEKWAPGLERRGLPVALVLQNGIDTPELAAWLERTWHRLDAVFIGGDDEFKLGPVAAELAREAKRRGKWVHWGRVNSRKRMAYCMSTGACDSMDGSSWARFRKTHLDKGLRWIRELTAQQSFDRELVAA